MGENIEKQNIKKQKSVADYFKQRNNRILPSFLLTFGMFFMLFIATPLDIYANNIAEFSVTLSMFVPWLIVFCLASIVGVFLLLYLVPKSVYNIIFVFLSIFFIMLFIQGNYLNFGLHSLAGDGQGGSSFKSSFMIIDSIVWIVAILLFVLLAIFLKKKSIMQTVCFVAIIAIVVTQITTVLSLAMTNSFSREVSAEENVPTKFLSTKNLTTISRNNNVFVFCVDRFDTIAYCEPNMQAHPELFSELEGFTYYNDNVAMYGRTYPAACHMLTNIKNTDGLDRKDYFNYAYQNNETLSVLDENDYLIDMYTDLYYVYEPDTHLPEYIDNAYYGAYSFRAKAKDKIAQAFFLMSLYRNAPLPFKVLAPSLTSHLINRHVQYVFHETDEQFYTTDMKEIYTYVSSHEFNYVDENKFSYIHMSGCHEVDYNPEWKYVKNRGKIEWSLQNSFDIINMYLKSMKEAGVYKDATIVITGDHSAPYDNHRELEQPRVTALFVKPSGVDSGELATSTAQTSHDNLWATIFKSENITPKSDLGRAVWEIPEGETVTRMHVWDHNFNDYYWKQSIWQVNGPAKNMNSWTMLEMKTYHKNLYK